MASILSVGKATIADASQLGDMLTRFGDAQSSVPLAQGGLPVWSYEVPAGKTVSLEHLWLWLSHGLSVGLSGNAIVDLGVIKWLVDGVQKAEFRMHGIPLVAGGQVGPCTVIWDSKRRIPFDLGDGIDFDQGQIIRLTVDTVAVGDGRAAAKYTARLIGTQGIMTGALVPMADAAGQDILNYTVPAGGFHMLSMSVHAYNSEPVVASLVLKLNGMTIFESGPLAMSSQSPAFAGSPYRGGFYLPAEGVILNHGDRLELYAHAWLDVGQIVGGMAVGTETAEGGGGGLAARVIGSPVVRRIGP